MHDRTLARLNHEWRRVGRGAEARRATGDLAALHPELLSGLHDLCDVLPVLEQGAAGRFAVHAAMLERCVDHPVLRRALLQLALPGLPGIARRINWGAPTFDRGECMAELVASAWELTGRWAGQHRPYCVPDLLSATRLATMRRVLALRPAARLDAGSTAAEDGEADRIAAKLDLEALGARLPKGPAAALYAQVTLGMGTGEAAARLGVSPRTIQRWNQQVATGLSRTTAVA